jgi:hypothetical protein
VSCHTYSSFIQSKVPDTFTTNLSNKEMESLLLSVVFMFQNTTTYIMWNYVELHDQVPHKIFVKERNFMLVTFLAMI